MKRVLAVLLLAVLLLTAVSCSFGAKTGTGKTVPTTAAALDRND